MNICACQCHCGFCCAPSDNSGKQMTSLTLVHLFTLAAWKSFVDIGHVNIQSFNKLLALVFSQYDGVLLIDINIYHLSCYHLLVYNFFFAPPQPFVHH